MTGGTNIILADNIRANQTLNDLVLFSYMRKLIWMMCPWLKVVVVLHVLWPFGTFQVILSVVRHSGHTSRNQFTS